MNRKSLEYEEEKVECDVWSSSLYDLVGKRGDVRYG